MEQLAGRIAVVTGPNLALPASPNGMFVVAAPNNTSYLVETNPLFVTGGATGSNGSPAAANSESAAGAAT